MPITQAQPTLELFDAEGRLIQQLSNLAAAREETQIVETVPITAAASFSECSATESRCTDNALLYIFAAEDNTNGQ